MRRIIAPLFIGANMLVAAALWSPSAGASAGALVPLTPKFRACDFTWATNVATNGTGTGHTVISKAAPNKVVAQVQLLAAAPQAHFNVRLIQSPSPSAGCGGGDAGVTAGGIDTDGTGAGTLTLQDTISANSTGVWVFVERPSAHTQTPTEFYTSEIITPI